MERNQDHNLSSHFLNNNVFSNGTFISIGKSTIFKSNPDDDDDTHSIESERVQDIIYLTLYSVTCVLALFGNCIVCRVVFGKPNMKTFTNLLLANMALSDIVCALMFPTGLLICWDGFILASGNHACVIAKAIQLTSFQVSSVTITVVAIDRFMLVHFPIVRSHRIIPAWAVMLCVWILSLIIIVGTSPSLAFHRYFTPGNAYIKCEMALVFAFQELSAREQRIRLIFANLTHFWIPLFAIVVCYGSIAWKVSRRKVGNMTISQQDIILRQKWKTIKMLIAACCSFFLCWFPFFILNLLDFFGNTQRKRPCNKSGAFFVAVWLAFSSCCYNPFVYWIYSKEFRDGLRQVGKFAKSSISISSRPSVVSYISSFREREERAIQINVPRIGRGSTVTVTNRSNVNDNNHTNE